MQERKKTIGMFRIGIAAFLSVFSAVHAQSHVEGERTGLVEDGYRRLSPVALPERPMLVDYEQVLWSGNPGIHAAYGAWQTEVKRIAAVRGLPDPRINFGYFLQNVETAVGPQEYRLGVMQTIPWLGKLIAQGSIQTKKAEAALYAMYGEIERQREMLHRVYYDSYYLERAIDITRQNLDLVRNWESVVLSEYGTGTAGHADLIKTQIESIQLEDDLQTLLAGRKPLLAEFGKLLGLDDLETIHLPDRLEIRPLTVHREELRDIVSGSNPEVNRMRSLEAAAAGAVGRARMDYLPDFSIGVDRIFTGNRRDVSGGPVPDSGKDPIVVTGSASIPLGFTRQAAGVAAAEHGKRQAASRVEETESRVRAELETILFDLDDAERKARLYRDVLVPMSLESLRSSEKAYVGGEADFLQLIDAQRRSLQLMLASERALVRYLKAMARLEAVAGRSL